MSSPPPADEPCKLFIGQIPFTMADEQIQPLFEPFGEIVEFQLLAHPDDPSRHRGCGFVTFATIAEADRCIEQLNESQTLLGCRKPLQVRYSDEQLEKMNSKLFVRVIPSSATEEQLLDIFSQFGTVVEVAIPRDPINTAARRDFAFVKFAARTDAARAVTALNGLFVMDGNAQPWEVRFADTPKEKLRRRKMRQHQAVAAPLLQQPLMMFNTPPASASAAAFAPYGQHMPGLGQHPPMGGPPAGALGLAFQNGFMMPPAAGAGIHPQPHMPGVGAGVGVGVGSASPAGAMASTQPKGPDGANLFVHGLPPEFTDNELRATFMPFGNILSATVMWDNENGRSKGFGFVSFDHADSARQAINAMNGFLLGTRRLQVRLKVNK